jgi:hypothetical protein
MAEQEDRYDVDTRYYRVNPAALYGVMVVEGVDLNGEPPSECLGVYYRHNKSLNTFTPYARGGKTVVVIKDRLTGKQATGVATCSLNDQFVYTHGRTLAMLRAFELLNQ